MRPTSYSLLNPAVRVLSDAREWVSLWQERRPTSLNGPAVKLSGPDHGEGRLGVPLIRPRAAGGSAEIARLADVLEEVHFASELWDDETARTQGAVFVDGVRAILPE